MHFSAPLDICVDAFAPTIDRSLIHVHKGGTQIVLLFLRVRAQRMVIATEDSEVVVVLAEAKATKATKKRFPWMKASLKTISS